MFEWRYLRRLYWLVIINNFKLLSSIIDLFLGGYFCKCPIHFSGLMCDILTNVCLLSPCGTYGTCKDNKIGGGYECECVAGHTGKK